MRLEKRAMIFSPHFWREFASARQRLQHRDGKSQSNETYDAILESSDHSGYFKLNFVSMSDILYGLEFSKVLGPGSTKYSSQKARNDKVKNVIENYLLINLQRLVRRFIWR